MTNPLWNYIGDDALKALLERHRCERPFHMVRMLILGAVGSPKSRLSPGELLAELWPAGGPEFRDLDEANDVLQSTMGLWNHMVTIAESGAAVRLTPHEPGLAGAAVVRHSQMRTEEIAGFLAGFTDGDPPSRAPKSVRRMVDDLARAFTLFQELIELVGRDALSGSDEETAEFVSTLREIDETVERIINEAVAEGRALHKRHVATAQMRRAARARPRRKKAKPGPRA